MIVRVLEKLKSGMERTRKYLSGRALILLYHRVADVASDPWQLAVSPQHFEEHLEFLKRRCRLVSLRDLSAALEEGRLPRRSVVVTFDDGYADNLLNAKPLLEKHDVPATVFITTGYTGEDREFWWDELDRLFMEPGVLPGTLSLQVNGNRQYWQLGDGAYYDEAAHQRDQHWRASQPDEPTTRHSLYRALWQLMHPMTDSERRLVRNELIEWAGAAGSARETHRVLAREEIIELTRSGLIDVGCHTVTHPKLSALSRESQTDEIRESKHTLEEIVDHPVTGFAYPYGLESDYTNETVSLVREAGFAYGCTAAAGVVSRHSDRYRLPRVQAQDLDGESFARVIEEWLP